MIANIKMKTTLNLVEGVARLVDSKGVNNRGMAIFAASIRSLYYDYSAKKRRRISLTPEKAHDSHQSTSSNSMAFGLRNRSWTTIEPKLQLLHIICILVLSGVTLGLSIVYGVQLLIESEYASRKHSPGSNV